MTDYKNLKLIASSSPHIHSVENTRSIMLDVIIAMLPALFWAIYNFGFKALLSVVVSVVACLFWEWLYRKLLKKPQSIGDLSAVVTGMLLAFVCPPELPWWALVIGAFFSIVVVKQLIGGVVLHQGRIAEMKTGEGKTLVAVLIRACRFRFLPAS